MNDDEEQQEKSEQENGCGDWCKALLASIPAALLLAAMIGLLVWLFLYVASNAPSVPRWYPCRIE